MKLFVTLLLIATTYAGDEGSSYCTVGADKLCGHCLKATGCTICWDSFPEHKVCTKPTTKVDKCISYSNATTCRQCDTDYMLDDNKCVKVPTPTIKHCKTESKGICTACIGFDIAADGKSCTTNNCALDGCEACGKNSGNGQTCVLCKSTHYINDRDVCVVKPYGMEKCNVSRDGKCVSCMPKFFIETFTSDTDFRCSAPNMFVAVILTTVIGLLF